MAIQHTWKITQMDRFIDTQVVFNVHFAIETIDTDKPPFKMIQNHATGIPFNPSDPVIPYAELSEETVLGWVRAELRQYQLNDDGSFVLDADGKRIEVGDNVPALLESGERQLVELINPVVETAKLPWAEQ